MKKWVVAIAMGGLIISFQNCSKSNLAGGSLDASAQENPVTTAPLSSLSPSQAVSIEVPNSPIVDEHVQAVSGKASAFNSYSLSLNPQTGVINILQADGQIDSSKEFCLSSAQIAELESLLASARLYEAYNDAPDSPDVVCSMEYRYPYAKLHFANQEVTLGEKFSGCDSGADLEQSSALKLKSFINTMVENLETSTCSFQEVH